MKISTFILKKLENFIYNPNKNCYLEFGIKTENYMPAFSRKISKINNFKNLEIEVDIEINNNYKRKHRNRSCFFVKSNFYNIKNFKCLIKSLPIRKRIYNKIKLPIVFIILV